MDKTIMIFFRPSPMIKYYLCAYCYEEVDYYDEFCRKCGKKFAYTKSGNLKRIAEIGELLKENLI